MPIIIDNVRFPRSIERTARGSGAKFKNRLIQGEGGDLTSTAVWERSLGEWTIESIPVINQVGVTQADIWQAICLFWAAMGQGTGFLYQPIWDCTFDGGAKVTVNGQLCKRYSNGVRTYDRAVIQDPSDSNKFLLPVMFQMDELDADLDVGNILTLPTLRFVEVASYSLNG